MTRQKQISYRHKPLMQRLLITSLSNILNFCPRSPITLIPLGLLLPKELEFYKPTK